ncbi:MAG TPA: hypothetical protein VGB56_00245, partial [Flavisolibacter sp.]
HFGVVEFDALFNPVDAYTISSHLTTNFGSNVLDISPAGNGLISVFEFLGSHEANVFFGSFNRQQFQKQRKVYYPNAGMPGGNGFVFLNDGGHAYLQTYFEHLPGIKSYFEFRKMYDSDTASQCAGKDTMLFHFLPLHIMEDPDYWLYDENDPDKMIEHQLQVNQTANLSTSSLDLCRQVNYCDTLKVHGSAFICGTAASSTFTSFKNRACGAITQWTIDSDAVDSLRVLNDSSIQVWFKNENWQGYIYANLPAGACTLPAKDSLKISITRVQLALDLGSDRALCPGNTILLNARKGYASYQWQDGSADSVFTVTQPGLYHVTTTDACGGIFKDSVLVTAAAPIPFSVGGDRTKCNSDTLHLAAPAGFINYSWSSNYNINSTTAQTVVVNPLVDTTYYIRAEKTPGCFAFDTVHVTVHHSPAISLGTDQSFCLGDSAAFRAGTGFQTYAWSNGATTEGIVVKSVGTYAAAGTTVEGCTSRDTVRVVSVYPLPVVALDQSPAICAGSVKQLDAGANASYIWNTGAATQRIAVGAIGQYSVIVTDVNGCKGSDTTEITTIHTLPKNFLPIDTAICSYGDLQLRPLPSFSRYVWSTGSTGASITISQPGDYWLDATDANGCKGRDSVLVQPKECL